MADRNTRGTIVAAELAWHEEELDSAESALKQALSDVRKARSGQHEN